MWQGAHLARLSTLPEEFTANTVLPGLSGAMAAAGSPSSLLTLRRVQTSRSQRAACRGTAAAAGRVGGGRWESAAGGGKAACRALPAVWGQECLIY